MPRTVSVKLTADITDLRGKLREGGTAVRQFAGEMDRAAKAGHLDNIANGAAVAGGALVGAFGFAVKAAADFDKQMSAVSAATGANAYNLDKLRQAALDAGKATQYSATEAAAGITELGKAGVDTQTILSGGLAGALDLAAAGQLDVADAAETAASALTQFRLSGKDVPHVADLLAAAAGKAQGSVGDMGYALKSVGVVASQFGLSIEDTTGALAAMASAGMIGSDAGTSLKSMIQSLQNPSKESRELMEELGLSVYDASGNFVGLSKLAGQLQSKMKGLTQETRDQAMAQIFGSDGIRAAAILYREGAKGVEEWTGKVNDAGFAQRTAAKLTDNLAGDVERLKGSLETMAIEAGGGANGGLRVLVKGLNELVDKFAELPPAVGTTLTVLAGLGGTALLAGAGWVKLRRTTADIRDEMDKLGPASQRAARGLGTVASAAGKAGIVFGALQVAGEIISQFQDKLDPHIDALAVSLQQFATGGQVAGEASRLLGGDMDKLQGQFQILADTAGKQTWARNLQGGLESLIPPLKGTDTSLANTKQRVEAVDQALAAMVQGGNAQAAADAYNKLAAVLATNGVSMDEFKAQFPGYQAALEASGAAAAQTAEDTTGLSGALAAGKKEQEEYKTATEAAAAATQGQRSALADLADFMKSETDPVFGLITAQDKLAAAQKAASKAIKEHGKNSDEAKAATRDLAQAAIELQSRVGGLGETFDGKMTPSLRATLQAAGLTDTQIKSLEQQFRDAKKSADAYDGKYEAKASAPGAGTAKKQLNDAHTAAKGFAGPYVAHLSVDGKTAVDAALEDVLVKQRQLAMGAGTSYSSARSAVQKDLDRNRQKRAAGGPIYGPGTATSDSIPALLSDGEYVIRASSVKKLGVANLDVMNREGRVPDELGFALGGLATWPMPADISKTKIPKLEDVIGGGPAGKGWKWMVAAVHAAFPGMAVLSTFRQGARTLSGNRSYHASGRAVDFSPSKPLAEWINAKYFGATRELITPWNSLNIWNGRRHTYTGDVYAQHAGTGRFRGNAHDHWAMARGGVIPEPVFGVGASGRTYSFGERGPERVIPHGYASGGLVNVAPNTDSGSAGTVGRTGTHLDFVEANLSAKAAVDSLTQSLKENGRTFNQNTAKGRDNINALIGGVKAAQDAAEAKYRETGSIAAANKVYNDYIRQLNKTLASMKLNQKQRETLLKAYAEKPKYDIPTTVPTAPSNSSKTIAMMQGRMAAQDQVEASAKAFAWKKPTFSSQSETGRAELTQLFSFLSAAQQAAQTTYEYTGNAKTATAIYNSYLDQLRKILGQYMSKAEIDKLLTTYGRITLTQPNRMGGVYEHAAAGSLKEAMIAAGGPTRYAWAEPSTGGELFAPKRGNLAKTRREVGWAVQNWWGGQVNWQPANAGAVAAARHITVDATIPIVLGAETITRQVRLEVDTAIGQVANATVYQTA